MLDYFQSSIKLAVFKNDSVNLFLNVKNTKLLLLIDELSSLDSKGARLLMLGCRKNSLSEECKKNLAGHIPLVCGISGVPSVSGTGMLQGAVLGQ